MKKPEIVTCERHNHKHDRKDVCIFCHSYGPRTKPPVLSSVSNSTKVSCQRTEFEWMSLAMMY